MQSNEEEIIFTENHFVSLSPKKKEFLKCYYDEMSLKFATDETGFNKNSAKKLIISPIGKNYLTFLESQEPNQGTTTRQDLVKELEKVAFSSLDDFVEVWKEEDEDKNGELVINKRARFSMNKIANMTGRERKKVLSSIGKLKTDRYGNINEISTDKLKALDQLAKLIGAYEKQEKEVSNEIAPFDVTFGEWTPEDAEQREL